MQYVEKKGAGVNPLAQVHYIDHLAVVCIIMGIPLIFIDPNDFALGQKYYPGLDAVLIDYHELTPEYLIAHYDVLFMSDLWDRDVFHEKYRLLEQKYKKALRHVHCPHGYSDKAFYLKKCAKEDIVLIYGQNMLDMLKEQDVFDLLNKYVICGNYRYTYYKQHRPFYDAIIMNEILPCFAKKQPIILYAPTWLDLAETTTFFDAYAYILGNLPHNYNMIVKLHPRLELDDAAKYHHIVGKYENEPNILFLKDFPLVFPLLAYTDIYLGDMSSVGYDFLPFNKPMFFLNKYRRDPKSDRELYLFRCGVDIKPDAYPLLYKLIDVQSVNDNERFSAIRNQVYQYTFGPERAFADIKKDIIQAYNT